MGLLTTAQKIAFLAPPVRFKQKWQIYTPQAAGSSTFLAVTIDEADDPNDRRCVIDPGERMVEGWNQSLAEPGRFSNGLYRIVCGNYQDRFYKATTSNYFYNSTGSYQADPVECHLAHTVYIWLPASDAWSELEMLTYRGQIVTCDYDDNNRLVTIEAISLAAVALQYQWTEDDGTTTDTGLNVTWP